MPSSAASSSPRSSGVGRAVAAPVERRRRASRGPARGAPRPSPSVANGPLPRAESRSATVSRVTSTATGSVARRYSWTRRGGSGASWTRKPSRRWWRVSACRWRVRRAAGPQPAADPADDLGALAVVADEGDEAVALGRASRACRCRGGGRRSAAPCRGSSRRRAARRAAPRPRRRARRRSARGRPRPRACAPAPRACGRGRRGGGWGPVRRPRSASSSGRTTAVSAELVEQREAAQRVGAAEQLAQLGQLALAGRLGGAGALRRGRGRPCPGSISSSSSAASRAARSSRSGSSAKLRSPTARSTPPLEVGEPAEGVERLAAGERHGDGADGEVARGQVGLDRLAAQRGDVDLPAARRRPTTRQVANSAESSKACSPTSRGDRLGRPRRGRRRRRGRGRSTSRPERRVADRAADDPGALRRRPAPAARQRRPAARAPRRSREAHPPPSARGTRGRDPAGDLVVDRARAGRPPPRRGSPPRPGRRSAPPRRRARPRSRGRGRSSRCPSRRCRPAGGGGRATSTSALLERPRRTPSP